MLRHELQSQPLGDVSIDVSCSGRNSRGQVPWKRVSELLPLTDPDPGLKYEHMNRPLIEETLPLKKYPPGKAMHDLKNKLLKSNNDEQLKVKEYQKRDKNCRLSYLTSYVKHARTDPYGDENLFDGGSCVRLVNDVLMFTDYEGRLKLSKLVSADEGVFSQVPDDPITVTDKTCQKRLIDRIYDIVPDRDGTEQLMACRQSHGLLVYNVSDTDHVTELPTLPCSPGLSSLCWSSGDLVTSDQAGVVTTWDLETRMKLFSCSAPERRSDWSCVSTGHHHRSVLLADRAHCHTLDIRSGDIVKQQLGTKRWDHDRNLGLRSWDQIRHLDTVDSENILPRYYIMTDNHLLLYDLRMTRGPVLTRDIGLGHVSPAMIYSRTRVDADDWIVMSDRWGDMRVTVMDWGHHTCSTLRMRSECVRSRCQDDSAPRVKSDVRSVGSWSKTVIRARAATSGAWLTHAVEQRAGLPFTGHQLLRDKSGNMMILAVNAAGDLFGKKLELNGEDDDAHEDYQDELLENWADKVLDKALLPKLVLYQEPYEIPKLSRYYTSTLPITLQSYDWCKHIRHESAWSSSVHHRRFHHMINRAVTERAGEVVALKIRYRKLGMPRLDLLQWPEELVVTEKVEKKNNCIHEARYINIKKAEEILTKTSKLKLHKPVNIRKDHAHGLKKINQQLEPDKAKNTFYHAVNHKLHTEPGLRDVISGHILRQFDKPSLGEYTEDSRDEKSNKHSVNILKIMTGELDHRRRETRAVSVARLMEKRSTVSSDDEGGTVVKIPGTEQTGDTSLKHWDHDEYWRDLLGLDEDVPLFSKQGTERRRSSGVDDDDEALMDQDNDDDFEL